MTFRERFDEPRTPMLILQIGLGAGAFAFFLLALIYAYQGWFTRYMADDFCNAVLFSADVVNGLLLRYTSGFGGNRYSNIWLVGISEMFGARSVAVLPAFHIVLWLVGLVWTMTEVRKSLKADWTFAMTAFLALSIAFFTLLQVPNRFQSVYWRSSMTTHFAPIVYGTLLLAYLIRGSRNVAHQPLPVWSYLIAFVSAFLVGGFSEPTDALQVIALVFAILAVWLWGKPPVRSRVNGFLAWALAGALLSLVVMILSPANELRLGEAPAFWDFLSDTLIYPLTFIFSTFGPLPLPTALSVLIPALLFWAYGQMTHLRLSPEQKRRIWLIILMAPVIMYILIAANFSPSVYGQGFPVERMRFAARMIMSICLLLEGSMLGLLLSQINLKQTSSISYLLLAGLFSMVAILYPLRAAWNAYQDVPEFRLRGELWDAREAFVYRHAALGEMDLVIPELAGYHFVKEWDARENHWVNRCAAEYYGVNSIRTVPVPDNMLLELFNE